MCVNKRREPTTDAQGSRRDERKPNFRASDDRCRVVRAWREIAVRNAKVVEVPRGAGVSDPVADIFRLPGIFTPSHSSFLMGHGGGTSHWSRVPHLGGVKQRKPGSPLGSRFFGHRGERSAGGGE
ncbi:hypothetical protein GCM10023336_57180 [Streptomyces similanensis]|uniref:Uncharacterized protein n=1 Tax=Streptomyces similanensis TaxID=1274988 RepID=A0ABP9L587_9ACTN